VYVCELAARANEKLARRGKVSWACPCVCKEDKDF
jgi:hypothetical protein